MIKSGATNRDSELGRERQQLDKDKKQELKYNEILFELIK